MIKTNYHTHCYLCGHAQGLPIDYIILAIDHGYQEIGISDHGPLLDNWTYRMNMNDFYQIYLQNIDEAIDKFADAITIYKGLELEYLEEYNQHYQNLLESLDYLILGQHIVQIDGEIFDIFGDVDDQFLIAYKDAVIKAMKTKYFKILAHPDLYLFSYRRWNDLTEKIARDIIEAAIENNVFLEINCNGIRRGRIKNEQNETVYIYPRKEFWKIVSEYKAAKIMIGEDNHAFKHVDDYACQAARDFADDLGLKVIDYLFGEKNEKI